MSAIEPARSRPNLFATVSPARTGRRLLALAAAGFALGGLESLALRAQLARSGGALMQPSTYHQILTLHGVSMVFLAVVPAVLALFLLLVPARIRDGQTAFPRLSAFGGWLWVWGALLLHAGLVLGGTSGAGMLGNASMTSIEWASRDTVYLGPFTFRANGVDWWATGMALVALAALCVVLDVVTTVFARRAGDKPLAELPPFAWNSALAGLLGLFAYPALLAAVVLLQADRLLEAGRFVPESGGDATLWARLTAILGHPQVAMLLLPVMGVVSEVVGAAAGRPVHGRGVMRASSALLVLAGLLGWLAQVTPAGAALAYALLPLAGALMALASGIAVFHWLATLWGRPVAASPALSFALGMAAMIMTGAFSTLPLAFQPAAARQVGTYFGVAHAHEMLFGGVVLGLVAALYHFYPKLTGRVLDARLGQLHFALTLVGAFVTFLPMHVLGLAGMPRRIHSYPAGMGWDALNSLASLGAIVLLAAGLVFLLALLRARPVAEPVAAAPEPAGTPGLMLLALGLALLAAGTLLGWIAGTLGAGILVFGIARLLGDAKS